MPKKYIVRLTDGERETWHQILKKRGVAAQRVRRASMLLQADVDGPSWADANSAGEEGNLFSADELDHDSEIEDPRQVRMRTDGPIHHYPKR